MKRTAMLLAALLGLAMPTMANTTTALEEIVEVKRPVAGYTKVKVNGPFEVNLVYGATGEVTLLGEKNTVGLITTQVVEGTLVINALQPIDKEGLTITIPYTTLDEVALIGNGSITAKEEIKNDNFRVTLDGDGKISVAVSAGTVRACILGDGDIRIKGSADNFDCKVVGTGAIKAAALQAEYVSATVAGEGNINANSTKSLKGRIDGKGNIAFSGEPGKTDLKHSGEGTFVY